MLWVKELAELVNRRDEKSREARQYALYRDRMYAARIPLIWESCVSTIELAVKTFNIVITEEHNKIHLLHPTSSNMELKLETPPYVLRFLEITFDLNARHLFMKDRETHFRQVDRRFEFVMADDETVHLIGGGSYISGDEFAQIVLRTLINGTDGLPADLRTLTTADQADANN